MKDPVEKVLELHKALGLPSLNTFDGPWVFRVDEHWTIAVNGQAVAMAVAPKDCMDIQLKPYEFAFWFNGWLAGLMDARGGSFAAGEAGNQRAFAEAVDRLIKSERTKKRTA